MKKMMVVVAALSLAFIGACGGGDGGGGGGGSTTACGTETQGCVAGNVVDGASLDTTQLGQGVYKYTSAPTDAVISIAGGAAITANTQGYFFTNAVAQGASIPLCVAATGYVTRCIMIDVVGGQTLSVPPILLMKSGEGKGLSTAGGSVTYTDTSSMVTIVAGDLCDETGTTPATGTVTCSLTPVDTSAASRTAAPTNNINYSPGNFTGTTTTGTATSMQTGGMMDISCVDATGARVNVCTGKTVTVQVPIYGNCADNSLYPSPISSWSFNATTGLWNESGVNAFVKNCGGADATANYYTGTISHFSYWNADQAINTTCLTGMVTRDGTSATPIAGAKITCNGVDYQGTSEATSGADGTFCVAVKAGGQYNCIAEKAQFFSGEFVGGNYVSQAITGTASATAAQCGGEGCTAMSTVFKMTDPLMRTVLTWGASPSDLDSHTAWTGDDIYFGKDVNPRLKELLEGKMGQLGDVPFIALDTDDTSSYGPEITTIVPGVAAGTYRFCVHNYLGQSSGPMEASSAVVNVISPGFNKEYPIPTSNPGNADVWRVYQVVIGSDNSLTFTDLNDYVSSETTGDVGTACMQ